MKWLKQVGLWFVAEYFIDYREYRARVFDTIIKNNLHLNTVILTVSVASLTAIAALNDKVFSVFPLLSVAVLGLFILTILFSTINFFLSGLAMSDMQRRLNEDILFPFKISKGEYMPRFRKAQRVLNILVLAGFCFGLIALLVLLTFYIVEGAR